MIEARIDRGGDRLVTNLTRKATALAEATIASRRLTPRDPARWRSSRLLWPLFTKD